MLLLFVCVDFYLYAHENLIAENFLFDFCVWTWWFACKCNYSAVCILFWRFPSFAACISHLVLIYAGKMHSKKYRERLGRGGNFLFSTVNGLESEFLLVYLYEYSVETYCCFYYLYCSRVKRNVMSAISPSSRSLIVFFLTGAIRGKPCPCLVNSIRLNGTDLSTVNTDSGIFFGIFLCVCVH